jgi:hypothetical protein
VKNFTKGGHAQKHRTPRDSLNKVARFASPFILVSPMKARDISIRVYHIGGTLCPSLRDGTLANLFLGKSQRRLEVREFSLNYVAAVKTAA